MKYYVTYAKVNGCKTFRALDINEGVFVGNIMYATQIECSEENKAKLQRLADANKESGLILQLRDGQRVIFQTA